MFHSGPVSEAHNNRTDVMGQFAPGSDMCVLSWDYYTDYKVDF